MQHSVQVDNRNPGTIVENHNQMTTEEEQSWESEYKALSKIVFMIVKLFVNCCSILHSIFSGQK
jgi:hypothetical protein